MHQKYQVDLGGTSEFACPGDEYTVQYLGY